jgi:hypothetical protein
MNADIHADNRSRVPGASFVLSLDCEGRWGVANFGKDSGHITNERLIDAYARLIGALGKVRIPATFAFVAALVLSRDEARAHPEWFAPMKIRTSDWYTLFQQDLRRGSVEGWLCPELLDIVRRDPRHEIASHGFSHCTLADDDISDSDFDREMRQLRAVEMLKALAARTFVFPCNRVGHLDRLAAASFEAYRPARAAETRFGQHWRIIRLAEEFNLWERPPPDSGGGRPAPLPPGRYINGRAGLRRFVPISVTLRKIAFMLDAAIENGGAVHLYSHPHEFIACHHQFELFEAILELVAVRVRAGTLVAETQLDYLRRRRGARGASNGK